ncbi:MAG TPA: hydrolase [Gemmatimonadaceae bacterium]|nr:hydrolase [Gemmatimonadaceae bacterium]
MATSPYVPAWWIPGPHLRTLWGKFFRRMPEVPVRLVRWDTTDADFLDLWRVDAPAGSPRILLLHGLEGGARSHYARGLLGEARRRGWGADLLIFRSCGAETNRTPRFYHSGETGDLAFVLDRLVEEFPESPFFLAGVSLGGNVLLKFLGERGGTIPTQVIAAAAVSVPYDLARSSRRIDRGFSRVYQAHFLRSLRRKAALKHAAFPDRLPAAALERARSLYAFDDVVTAPLHGFVDAEDYYSQSSAIRWLPGITVPALLLSAVDDPFLPEDVLEDVRKAAFGNTALHVEFVERGGHVGFIAGRFPWRPIYYMERRLGEFFAQQLKTRSVVGAL